MNRFAALLTILTIFQSSVLAAQGAAKPGTLHRQVVTQLPRGITPLHYALSVRPDPDAMTFSGHVEINLKVERSTASITLNALDLKFGVVALKSVNGSPAAKVVKTTLQPNNQTVVVHLDRPIDIGIYRLEMDYVGVIGTQASGLFALTYDSSEGTKKGLYTQFEPAEARRFIPSWDEPNYKATFTLETTVPAGHMAISNMPVVSTQELDDGRRTIRFGKSPRMSTYLLFLASGDFERATLQVGPTELGVVTKRGSLDQAQEALKASRPILEEFNDYFGVPYPLPKLDNVAAPGSSQFFGAMENWGAIFSFESVLLIDPRIATARNREYMFSTTAHEIAHQWFGNLVTMQWWDDLWLNEGFASWMESRTTAKLRPEWNSHLNSVFTRDWAMQQDALKTTHPIVQPIKSVAQASQAFDGITYSKGQMVIQMLESHIGEDAWRTGVRSYIKKHAYANTKTSDLWDEMDKASGQPVTAMADDFTRQPGVPLIQVKKSSCINGRLTLDLAQGEFSDDQPRKKPLRWRVPVKVQSFGSMDVAQTIVEGGRGRITLSGCTPPVVNAGQSGYFRTAYGQAHFRDLVSQFGNLPTIDQLGLLLDTWALGAAGMQPVSNYLNMVDAIPSDADPTVWKAVAQRLQGMHYMLDGEPNLQGAFDAFARTRLGPVLKMLGWQVTEDDSHSTKLLRTTLIQTLSVLGDAEVIHEARRRYDVYRSNPNEMPAELRRTVLGVVAYHADNVTWEKLRADAREEISPLVKKLLYERLASTLNKDLAYRALELALTPEVGETNSANMISIVSELHPELAFDFSISHMDAVNKKLDESGRTQFFSDLASHSAKAEMMVKVKSFARKNLTSDARRSAEEAAASISRRIAQRKHVVPSLTNWLKQKKV